MRLVTSGTLCLALLLAGCQSAPQTSSEAAAGTGAASTGASAATAQPEAAETAADVGHARPLDFYLAHREQIPGFQRTQVGPGWVWMSPQPVLTRADVLGVAPHTGPAGESYVSFDLTEDGRRKLAQTTRQAAGLLLLVTIGNEVVAAPRINAPLTDNVFHLPVQSAEQARALVAAILRPVTPAH